MSILFLAATSDIARQSAKLFAGRGEQLVLAGRNPEALNRLAAELGDGATCLVYTAEIDLADAISAEAFWQKCLQAAGGTVEGVYIAQGFLPSRDSAQWVEEIEQTFFLNLTSLTFFLEAAARWFEQNPDSTTQRWVAALASVAGDRGRLSNYPYGAAKAGLEAYLSGLRARLYRVGVSVLTIKPGLVRTKMIHGRPQEQSRTVVLPERIARDVDRAIRHRKDVLYTPYRWVWIMRLVRCLPEWLFKRVCR